jgi:hypothetical protein
MVFCHLGDGFDEIAAAFVFKRFFAENGSSVFHKHLFVVSILTYKHYIVN